MKFYKKSLSVVYQYFCHKIGKVLIYAFKRSDHTTTGESDKGDQNQTVEYDEEGT